MSSLKRDILLDVLLGAFPLDLEQYLQTCSEPLSSRAMELGRECLKLWGYERVDEIIWVKTNQLQRIIRTGRTGHWLNHGKVIYWLIISESECRISFVFSGALFSGIERKYSLEPRLGL